MAVSLIFPSSRCNVANTIPGRSMGGICCHGIRT
jgi:hypothetical protein